MYTIASPVDKGIAGSRHNRRQVGRVGDVLEVGDVHVILHGGLVRSLLRKCVAKTYRQHSDNRSTPIDQEGLRRPKAGDKVIDQQGSECQEKPAESDEARLKAWLEIHTQVFQHAEQICMAALIFIGPKCLTLPSHCKKQSDRQAPSATVTDPFEDQSILARISIANDAKMYTDLQGLDLTDSPQQLDVQDLQLRDQQHPGQTEAEPISGRKL